MLTTLVLAAGLLLPAPADSSTVRSDLQGLYEEINQTKVQAIGQAIVPDIEALYATLYTTDWTFVDKKGDVHPLAEMRQKDIDAIQQPFREVMYQPVRKLLLSSDGNTATVTIADDKATYKDTWVKDGDTWKMKTRQEL